MKTSLILAIVLALILGSLGWRKTHEIDLARNDCDLLEAKARSLGVDAADAITKLRSRPLSIPRPDVKDLIRRMAAFSVKAGELSRVKKPLDRETTREEEDFLAEVLQLQPGEIGELLRALRESPDVDPDGFQEVISDALLLMASEDPKAALEFCADTSGPPINPGFLEQATTMALKHWGMKDPRAALAWVGNDEDRDTTSDTMLRKWEIFDGLATQDSRMAFSLIPEMSENVRQGIAGEVARSAKDDASRTGVLQGLRDYVARNPDSEAVTKETLCGLAVGLSRSRFKEGARWLDEAQLKPGEVEGLLAGFDKVGMMSDIPRWVDRIASQIPEDGARQEALRQAYEAWHQFNPDMADRLAAEIGLSTGH